MDRRRTPVDPPARPDVESVWDYPRPPAVEAVPERIRVLVEGTVIVDTTRAHRVLETSHPPAYYIPAEDVREDVLRPSTRTTVCEFKGRASYADVVVGDRVVRDAAWRYRDPAPGYEPIRDAWAFYPGRVDEAWVGDERVEPQAGDFYGGWITSRVVGPFKGGPGTWGW